SRVIAYYSAERGHPARQVTVNRVTLFLESIGGAFVLLLNGEAPVVVNAKVSAYNNQAAIVEKRVSIQIPVPEVHLQVRQRLDCRISVDFRETFRESRQLRVHRKGHPRQRIKPEIVEKVLVVRAILRIFECSSD